jgi:HK97 family phage major capsid protein
MPVASTLNGDILAKQEEVEKILQSAEKENRALTDDERGTIDAKLAEMETLQAEVKKRAGDDDRRARLAGLRVSSDAPPTFSLPAMRPRALGRQFVESEGYKRIRGMQRSGSWSGPIIDLAYNPSRGAYEAATLTPDGASGGALVLPDYRPGILETLYAPLTVADLFAQGTTTSNTVSYMRETTATNAAAAVAPGAAKPESTLVFDAETDPVVKIATWLPVADEMLEDVSQLESYINQRLSLFVQITEEAQLLNGSGVAPNMEGLLERTGLLTDAAGTETAAESLFLMIQRILFESFLQPDAIVLPPDVWGAIAISKTDGGDYYGGGPFAAAPTPTLWGYRVAISPVMPAATGLVGAFKTAAQIFRRTGMSVQASNSHSDYFVKNLTAIRAETRLALAVYRPQGFGTVTGLATAPAVMRGGGAGAGGEKRLPSATPPDRAEREREKQKAERA